MRNVWLVKGRKGYKASELKYCKGELNSHKGFELKGYLSADDLLTSVEKYAGDDVFVVMCPNLGGLIDMAAKEKGVQLHVLELSATGFVPKLYGVEKVKNKLVGVIWVEYVEGYEKVLERDLGITPDMSRKIPLLVLGETSFLGFTSLVLVGTGKVEDLLKKVRGMLKPEQSSQFEKLILDKGVVVCDGNKVYFGEEDLDSHYKQGEIEPIDIIGPHKLSYNVGAAIKYITRMELKGQKEEDKRKLLAYLSYAEKYEDVVSIPLDKVLYYCKGLNLGVVQTLLVYKVLTNDLAGAKQLVDFA